MSDEAVHAWHRAPVELLQELLDLPALDARQSLTAAATSVARWFECEKTDVFLLDSARSSLVAMGTSETPLGELQRQLGLDVMALPQGGRSVQVFQTGEPHWDGHVERDPEELRGISRELGVRSQVVVPLSVAGSRRGVLSIVSQQPEHFGPEHLRLLGLVGGWIGALVHRAELVEKLRAEERASARRAATDEIISVLAHDVWNHLNPLSARLQMLQLRLGRGEQLHPSMLDAALMATQRLARLSQNLLDSARLEHRLFELQLAPVELRDLVTDVARICSTPSAEVLVDCPRPLSVIADGDRLRQALENVVMNGVRHADGKPVRLSVEIDDGKQTATIHVKDSGPGIDPMLLPKLFERFVAGGRSRGMGLGLYLARGIALAHGGRLDARSRLGEGADFCFELPLAGPSPD